MTLTPTFCRPASDGEDADDDLQGLHAERHDGARRRAAPPGEPLREKGGQHVADAEDEPRDDEDGERLFELGEEAARGDREAEQRGAHGEDHDAEGEAQAGRRGRE